MIVGYHGGRARVRRFSAKMRRRAEYGNGFYFADDYGLAERFGPVVGAYELHLRNPLRAGQFDLKRKLSRMSGQDVPPAMREQGAWVTRTARQLGYDGLVVDLVTGQRYYVAFFANQVRYVEPGPAPEVPTTTLRVTARLGKPEPAFRGG